MTRRLGLPAEGLEPAALLELLERYREHDVDWRSGKLWAYVFDPGGEFERRCNPQMVELEPLDAEDVDEVLRLILRHVRYTNSAHAANILTAWDDLEAAFVKVTPRDYKRVRLAEARVSEEQREPSERLAGLADRSRERSERLAEVGLG